MFQPALSARSTQKLVEIHNIQSCDNEFTWRSFIAAFDIISTSITYVT